MVRPRNSDLLAVARFSLHCAPHGVSYSSRRMLKDKGHTGIFQDSASGSSFNVKILVTLADEERCVRPQELVAEDLGQEDVVGLVLGLEPVAADGSVGASEVARFPGLVQGTEGVGNILGIGRTG
jgi:hypothetical protein